MNTNSELNRRSFVKKTGLAGSAILASQSMISTLGFQNMDDAIKVGLIGCGGRGTGAAVQALSTKENVQLVAMADAFQDNVEKSYDRILSNMKEKDQGTGKNAMESRVNVSPDARFHGFNAYKEVIKLCDVVILTTPPGFRPIHFEEAIKANKHVFMEKPVATDSPGIRKVLEVAKMAKAKKLNVVVGLQRHYQTSYRKLNDQVKSGAIGEILGGQVYWNSAGVWVRERTPDQTEMEYQMRNWYYFNWLCGDHITEQHIHNIDVANWLIGSYPVRAQGMGGREVRNGKDHGEIFDHHFVEFEYANGAVISSQCRHIPSCLNRVTENFQGTKGRLWTAKGGRIEDLSGNIIHKYNDKNDDNPYQVEHDELFAAIAKGEFKYTDAENGAMSTMSSLLGRSATYSGKSVSMEEALASELSLMPERFAFDANPPVMPDADGNYPIPVPGVSIVI